MTVTKEVPTKSVDQSRESNFTTTLKRILELLDLEAEDDYGILKPTEYAFKTAMQLVVETYEIMGNSFPSGSESTDEEGSIFLNWISQDRKRSVIIFCPCSPEKPAYFYHDTSDEHAAESDVSASKLVHWLEWFNAS